MSFFEKEPSNAGVSQEHAKAAEQEWTVKRRTVDPDQTLKDLADAETIDEKGKHAENLTNWILRGGFAPRITGNPTFDRFAALAICQAVKRYIRMERGESGGDKELQESGQ